MNVLIYEYDDYKRYLLTYQKALPKRGHGFKSRLAEAADCRTAYVAQVLNGHAHFSAEQAEGINGVLGHNDAESEFFLLLVQLNRAGTERLRTRIRARMEAVRASQVNSKQRFQAVTELKEQDLYEFFGSWYVNAVQMAATIPKLRTRSQLRRALELEEALLDQALEFLIGKGLLKEVDGKLEPGVTRVFIGKDSPILKVHHANWRNKAIQALDHASTKDIHFTSVYSLSKKDAAVIRERLIREIESVRKTVKESPEEELHTFTLDFWRVDRD
jgi:uncharacterized protein (TIGR02147 family)